MAAPSPNYQFNDFATLPVLYNGRVQPLDTLARQSLLSIQEKTSVKRDDTTISPAQWLLDMFTHSSAAYDDKLFKIDYIDLKTELGLDKKDKYFSYNELKENIIEIEKKGRAIAQVDSENRSYYQNNLYHLYQKVSLFLAMQNAFLPFHDINLEQYTSNYEYSVKEGLKAFNKYNAGDTLTQKEANFLVGFNSNFKFHSKLAKNSVLYLFPNQQDDRINWNNTGSELLSLLDPNQTLHPLLKQYAAVFSAYSKQDATAFNTGLMQMKAELATIQDLNKTLKLETQFHRLNPFYKAMILYIIAFVIALFFYMSNNRYLYRIASSATYIAFALHSYGLIARMLIQNRPPVTNLYSSAIFVGWFAIIISMLQDKYFKNKLGTAVASLLGFITLIVAHHLSFQGDTLEVMQAVLNSNFWLSTHVVIVTLGYSGTFFAGTLATLYVLASFIKPLSKEYTQELSKFLVGIICFSLLFSFVGTVLGGIWGDQSWGRFWGWDPKENGALLIVIWNAIILHARLAKRIKTKGLALLCIAGNIVTAFSWFGVNMLGIGLHSYGFMDEAFFWLLCYCIVQVLLILAGSFNIKPSATKSI